MELGYDTLPVRSGRPLSVSFTTITNHSARLTSGSSTTSVKNQCSPSPITTSVNLITPMTHFNGVKVKVTTALGSAAEVGSGVTNGAIPVPGSRHLEYFSIVINASVER